MWTWGWQLRQFGFRCRSPRYWQCERGFGLPRHAYVSIFTDGKGRAAGRGEEGEQALEISALHVTFPVGMDNLHFYYHETVDGVWEPGGHTSSTEIRRYEIEPRPLRDQADAIAAQAIAALGGVLSPRP